MGAKDTRYNDRRKNAQKHFKKHEPRTDKDRSVQSAAASEDRAPRTNNQKRKYLQGIAEETLELVETDPGISAAIKEIWDDVKYYPEGHPYDDTLIPDNKHETVFVYKVGNIVDIIQEVPEKTVCHNFASARNPGGGFQNGSMAFEEALCYASGSFKTIDDCDMYYNNEEDNRNGYYWDELIYSPRVPFFRNGKHEITPIKRCSVITCPAVNVGAAKKKKSYEREKVLETMEHRMDCIFYAAATNGEKNIIIGPWGCGVFENQLDDVIGLYKKLLNGKYKGVFEQVWFVSLDQDTVDRMKEIK